MRHGCIRTREARSWWWWWCHDALSVLYTHTAQVFFSLGSFLCVWQFDKSRLIFRHQADLKFFAVNKPRRNAGDRIGYADFATPLFSISLSCLMILTFVVDVAYFLLDWWYAFRTPLYIHSLYLPFFFLEGRLIFFWGGGFVLENTKGGVTLFTRPIMSCLF